MKQWLVFMMILIGLCDSLHAQSLDSIAAKAVAASVVLDSVVVTATKGGLDVEDFVELVLTDESMYTAFRNLRKVSCKFQSEMKFVDKREQVGATLMGDYIQQYADGCRELTTREEVVSGDYFKGRRKKQKARYYTSQLYNRVFITEGRVCEENTNDFSNSSSDKMESRVDELKQLIFNPGHKARVPLIGNRTELFSEDMIERYDFSITSDTLAGQPAYRFTASPKEDVGKGKTIIKLLETWFARSDFQVLAREYWLVANTTLYDFDVRMKVNLDLIGALYYPTYIRYEGTWDIPTKKRETGYFELKFSDFSH